jgi:putative transposase
VGKKTGPNPTDRAKIGTKRSMLVEGAGVPVGLAVDGANRNDHKLARETIESIPIKRPKPTLESPQNLCADKAYDCDEIRELAEEFSFTAHIPKRGEEPQRIKRTARKKARRWVVERTHSWLNRFRRLLVRWEVRGDTYVGMLHFALGLITWLQVSLPK